MRLGEILFAKSLADKWRELSDEAEEDDDAEPLEGEEAEAFEARQRQKKKKRGKKIESDLDVGPR